MSEIGAPRHDPVPIGDIATPPFARLPDPTTLFAKRRAPACFGAGFHLGPYLRFLAELADIQHSIQDGLAAPDVPPEDARARAREFGMPPLDRTRFVIEPVFETTLDRLFDGATAIDMPDTARAALLPSGTRMLRCATRWCAMCSPT